MSVYTIVTTTATEGKEEAEINSLTDEFANVSEAIGYSRRMAEEMVEMAGQMQIDFDYSNIGVFDGDLIDEDLTPDHPSFQGLWVLDAQGPEYVTAEEFAAEAAEEGEEA